MSIKLTKLKLDHIGGFKDFEMNFHEKLTVLIGKNGSGKTTILSSIAEIIDIELTFLLHYNKGINDDSTDKALKAINALSSEENMLLRHSSNRKSHAFFKDDAKSIEIKLENNNNIIKELTNYLTGLYGSFLSKNISPKLPLFVYYPSYQAPLGAVEFSELKQDNNIFDFYISACKEGSFDFNRFFNWFRWQENLNKELRNGSPSYKIVREAICKVLSDGDNKYSNLHITWKEKYTGDLSIEKNDISLHVNQLSAGEKMLLILTADLARRLILANPEVDNPLGGAGIILIDEIDLHLHPSWQRNIIPKLTENFPNCQFIVSTHSPLILADVKPENIIILENFKAFQNKQHTLGRDSNSILSDIMGESERPQEMKKELDQCFSLVDDDKFNEAKDLVDRLEKKLGPNDPDIVYIHSLLGFYQE